jgi:DNA-binding response OmpR family regulator
VADLKQHGEASVVSFSLGELRFDLASTLDLETGLVRVQAGLFDVVVMEWVTSQPSASDLLVRLRSAEGPTHIHAIVMMTQPTASSVSAAFAAGADDLLRRPFLREELIVPLADRNRSELLEPGRRDPARVRPVH